ncbi:hypothetical protein WA158_001662 [Blastocystis sp. Blastoise]
MDTETPEAASSPFNQYHTLRPKKPTEDSLRYISQIQGVLDNTEDPEEKITLISNVNQELRGMEVSLATDRKVSFTIEKIIKASSRSQLRLFLSYCKGFTIHMFTQRYASHVMQTALEQASYFLRNKESTDTVETTPLGEPLETLSQIIIQIVSELSSSFNKLMCDPCATHVIRILLCILCGYPPYYAKEKKHLNKGKRGNNEKHIFPQEYESSLLLLTEEMNKLSLEEMEEVLTNQYGSPVIQLLLTILPATSSVSLATSILQIQDDDDVLSYSTSLYIHLIKNTIGARTLEAITPFIPNKKLIIIYSSLVDSLLEYVDDRNGNYVIQQLLACIYEKNLVKKSYEILSPSISALYKSKKGVVLQLFNSCRRNQVYDKEISELLKPILLGECDNRGKSEPKDSKDEAKQFIMSILGLKENGGKIELNEKTCPFFYEYVQLASPLSLPYIYAISKMDFISLLRLCIYLRGDIVYTVLSQFIEDKNEKKSFVAFIKGFKYSDSPVLRSKISDNQEEKIAGTLKKITRNIKHQMNRNKSSSKKSEKRNIDNHEDINNNVQKESKKTKIENEIVNNEEKPKEELKIEEAPKTEEEPIKTSIADQSIHNNEEISEPKSLVRNTINKLGFKIRH